MSMNLNVLVFIRLRYLENDIQWRSGTTVARVPNALFSCFQEQNKETNFSLYKASLRCNVGKIVEIMIHIIRIAFVD